MVLNCGLLLQMKTIRSIKHGFDPIFSIVCILSLKTAHFMGGSFTIHHFELYKPPFSCQ